MAQISIGIGTRWAITAVTLSLLTFAAVEWAWQTFAPPQPVATGSHATFADLLESDGMHVVAHLAGGIVALLLSSWLVVGAGREAATGLGVRPTDGSSNGEVTDVERVFTSSQQAAARLGLPVLVVARPRLGRPVR